MCLWPSFLFFFCLSRFLERGCDEALFSEKKGLSVKRGEAIQWMGGLVRRNLQERQFSEEVRAIQWTAGLWKLKSCCPHPLPKNQLLFFYQSTIAKARFALTRHPLPSWHGKLLQKEGSNPSWWVRLCKKNLKKSPALQQRRPQIDTHLKGGCFSCLGIFSSSVFLSFSPLILHNFPLFLDILKPKMAHQKGL